MVRAANPIARAAGAGAVYFAIVFAWAFGLGILRVLVVAPRLGDVAAVCLETPLVLGASWLACRWTAGRWAVPAAPSARLTMGLVAFLLLMAVELALSVFAFGRPATAWLAGIHTPAGAIGLAAQVAFGFVPLVQRSTHRP